MVTIRYRNFIINGTDMSGKEASVTQKEADKLVHLGYAEFIPEVRKVSEVIDVHEVSETPTKRGKKRGSKNSNSAGD